MNKYYMHLIDGKPGFFDDDQIVYAGRSIKTSQMRKSLAQVNKEQDESRRFRILHGFDLPTYSYILVKGDL